MDFIIVSIIILAAFLYTGNRVYQKYKVARSGETPCGCAPEKKSSACASCAHLVKTNKR